MLFNIHNFLRSSFEGAYPYLIQLAHVAHSRLSFGIST
jgi:hypothetical protein